MQATVTLNGQPAGECSAPSVPLRGGTVQLACDDPAAAAAYEEQIAQAEEGGEVVLNWAATCEAYGEAKVDVAQQVAHVEQELEEAEQEMQSAGGAGAPPPPPTTGGPAGAPSSEPSSDGESGSSAAPKPDANNNGLGPLQPVNAKDPAADALAKRIGGVPSVKSPTTRAAANSTRSVTAISRRRSPRISR